MRCALLLRVLLKLLAELGSTLHILGYCWYAACDWAMVELGRRLER